MQQIMTVYLLENNVTSKYTVWNENNRVEFELNCDGTASVN